MILLAINEFAGNCSPGTSWTTDTGDPMFSIHCLWCTNSLKLSVDLPNCMVARSMMAFKDSKQVVSLWSVTFPASPCGTQCFSARWNKLYSACWHCQQKFYFQEINWFNVPSEVLSGNATHHTNGWCLCRTVPTLLPAPDLCATVTPALSSPVFSIVNDVLSSSTTYLISFKILFLSLLSNDLDWPLIFSSVLTWTRRTLAESCQGHFWGTVILLDDHPYWVTLTTTDDSWYTLLPSPLSWMGGLVPARPHMHGTYLLLCDLALLGDLPRQPTDCTLVSHHLLAASSAYAPPPPPTPHPPPPPHPQHPHPTPLLPSSDCDALLPWHMLLPCSRSRSAKLVASLLLLPLWNLTSRSSTKLV